MAQGWFLTWPRCLLTPDELLPSILVHLPPVKWCIIAQEHHEDGGLHVHAAVFFERRFQPKVFDKFDDCAGQHGNYQTMKSMKGSIAYLHKEDPCPLVYGKIPTFGQGAQVFSHAVLRSNS